MPGPSPPMGQVRIISKLTHKPFNVIVKVGSEYSDFNRLNQMLWRSTLSELVCGSLPPSCSDRQGLIVSDGPLRGRYKDQLSLERAYKQAKCDEERLPLDQVILVDDIALEPPFDDDGNPIPPVCTDNDEDEDNDYRTDIAPFQAKTSADVEELPNLNEAFDTQSRPTLGRADSRSQNGGATHNVSSHAVPEELNPVIKDTGYAHYLRSPPSDSSTACRYGVPREEVCSEIAWDSRCASPNPVQIADISEHDGLKRIPTSEYFDQLLLDQRNSTASNRLLRVLKDERVAPASSLGLKLLDLVKALRIGDELGAGPKRTTPREEQTRKSGLEPIEERLNDFADMLNHIAVAVGVNVVDEEEDERIEVRLGRLDLAQSPAGEDHNLASSPVLSLSSDTARRPHQIHNIKKKANSNTNAPVTEHANLSDFHLQVKEHHQVVPITSSTVRDTIAFQKGSIGKLSPSTLLNPHSLLRSPVDRNCSSPGILTLEQDFNLSTPKMSEGPLAFKSEIATATKCEAKDKDKGKAREAEDRSELQNSRKRDQHPISVEIPSKTDIPTGRSANTAAVPVNPAHLVDDFEDVDSQLSGITGAAYNVDEPRTPSASRNDRPTVRTISNAETRQPPSLSTESFDLTNDWSGVSDFVSDSPSAPSSPSSVFARMQNLSAAPTFEAAACSARFPVWPSMAAHNVQPVSGNQPLYASLDPTIPHSGHARLPAYPASVMYQDASVPLDRPPFNPFDEAAIQREMSRREREAAIEARRRSTGNMFNPANASKNPFIDPSNHVGYPSSSLYQSPAPIRGYAGHQPNFPHQTDPRAFHPAFRGYPGQNIPYARNPVGWEVPMYPFM